MKVYTILQKASDPELDPYILEKSFLNYDDAVTVAKETILDAQSDYTDETNIVTNERNKKMGLDLHFIDIAPQQYVTMADKTTQNLTTIVDVLLKNPNNKQYQNYFLEIDNNVDFPFTPDFSTSYYRWNLINRFLLKGLVNVKFNQQEKKAFEKYKTTKEFITPTMISALLKLAANIKEKEFDTQPYVNDKYFKQYYDEFINYISTYRDYCLHFS